MENIVESIGEKISKARHAKGWSQEKLSEEANTNRRTVQNIEGSKVESPGIDVVVRLARALDLSVSYLIDDKPTRGERVLALQAKLLTMSEDDFETVEMTANNLLDLGSQSLTNRKSSTNHK